jgi:hypothetical protein
MTLQPEFIQSESVASILERDGEITIQNWLEMVEESAELTWIHVSRKERAGHLPILLRDLIRRLRFDRALATPISMAVRDHGKVRRQQGYTAYHGGRRISFLAGQHFRHLAKERE